MLVVRGGVLKEFSFSSKGVLVGDGGSGPKKVEEKDVNKSVHMG